MTLVKAEVVVCGGFFNMTESYNCLCHEIWLANNANWQRLSASCNVWLFLKECTGGLGEELGEPEGPLYLYFWQARNITVLTSHGRSPEEMWVAGHKTPPPKTDSARRTLWFV